MAVPSNGARYWLVAVSEAGSRVRALPVIAAIALVVLVAFGSRQLVLDRIAQVGSLRTTTAATVVARDVSAFTISAKMQDGVATTVPVDTAAVDLFATVGKMGGTNVSTVALTGVRLRNKRATT